eukprot:97343_1
MSRTYQTCKYCNIIKYLYILIIIMILTSFYFAYHLQNAGDIHTTQIQTLLFSNNTMQVILPMQNANNSNSNENKEEVVSHTNSNLESIPIQIAAMNRQIKINITKNNMNMNDIFQLYLHNKVNNKTFYCNQSHFKYIELLMNDIKIHNNTFTFKWNSSLITSALSLNTNFISPRKTLRLKYVNNKLYIHKPYGYKGNGWSKQYCTAFITYFWLFVQKYKPNIPSFDILIYVMDNLHHHFNFVHDYNRIVPIFVSDSYSD